MKTYSILRTKEDECVSKLKLSGRVLDLGGHRGSSYFALIRSENPVEVANFDANTAGVHKEGSGADHVFDFEKPFPLPNESYHAVISMNVLEHIYDHAHVLREVFRILKQGGALHFSVPFFFNIHGSPHDYFRYTKMALERLLADAGFSSVTVKVLGDGPCSVMFQTFGGSLPTLPLKLFAKRIAMGTDSILSRISSKYAKISDRVPLGYFVSAKKE